MPRFEEYSYTNKKVPFVLRKDILRTPLNYTGVSNWHDDLELEYIKEGSGVVFLDKEKYYVKAGDFIFVKSNVLHQLIPDSDITYSCLIIDCEFCKSVNFWGKITPHFVDAGLSELFLELEGLYKEQAPSVVMKLYGNLINQLIILSERHALECDESVVLEDLSTKRTKKAILYIRENFAEKITLEKIAGELFVSKFLLSREFKKITHTTVIEYLNAYRCKVAAEKIRNGISVSEAAFACGYENMSYFSRTFKKYMGILPSKI